jgi:hypothetical protein
MYGYRKCDQAEDNILRAKERWHSKRKSALVDLAGRLHAWLCQRATDVALSIRHCQVVRHSRGVLHWSKRC